MSEVGGIFFSVLVRCWDLKLCEVWQNGVSVFEEGWFIVGLW